LVIGYGHNIINFVYLLNFKMNHQKTYDWIIIGGGITGSALSYELAKLGLRVLLLEKQINPHNATYFSYGGIFYWAGTDENSRQLAQEGKEIHRHLTEELDYSTEFREIPLLLTIAPEDDYQTLLKQYQQFSVKPQCLDPQQAWEIEPNLNKDGIQGAFLLPYAQINPQKTNQAYQIGFQRQRGEIKRETAIALIKDKDTIKGVKTDKNNYFSENTVICAGGLSRNFLTEQNISLPLYFTHTYLLKTPPVDVNLQTSVMAAHLKRLELEQQIDNFAESEMNKERQIIDAGAIQFRDNSLCLGQISEINPNPDLNRDLAPCEQLIRQEVGKILPCLKTVKGTIHHCLVAFQPDKLALVGKVPDYQGIYLFSGFTSTWVFAPPLARHFAQWVNTGEGAKIIEGFYPFIDDRVQ
jgi:glycine/D-amino acid oxidase-like deaminating enzyme